MTALDFGSSLLCRIEGEVVEGRTGHRLGGKKLQSAVAACAKTFRGLAEQSEGPILLALELTLESVTAYLGALASGRTVVPIDSKEWRHKGIELIELLQPAICWFPARMKLAMPIRFDCLQIVRGTEDAWNADFRGDVPSLEISPSDGDKLVSQARVMIPTSGSTGKPSLVRVTDLNLFSNTSDIITSQGLLSQDKALLCLPLNYCFGASVLHSHLWVGGSVVVDDRLMFPEKVLNVIESEGCTTFAGVPTSFLFLHSYSTVLTRNFSKLRLWLQAGGYLAASVVHAFRTAHPETAFVVMYGQTEATARITSFTVDGDYPRGCVGYPMASLQVEIRAENGEASKPGCEGDVWIRGASVCAGYFSDPEREAEKFVNGWLNTGDVGYLLEDGRLCITGRSDGFIKIRGRRVSSLEIEDIVWKAFSVRSCACAVPHQASGEVIGLYLECFPRGINTGQNQRSGAGHRCSEAGLADAKGLVDAEWAERIRRALPQHWDLGPVMCGELPFTSSGKINRRACSCLLTKAGEGLCQ